MMKWTIWQWITNLLVRMISFGLHPGRCGVCGAWMHEDFVVPGVGGAVCYNCDPEYNLSNFSRGYEDIDSEDVVCEEV